MQGRGLILSGRSEGLLSRLSLTTQVRRLNLAKQYQYIHFIESPSLMGVNHLKKSTHSPESLAATDYFNKFLLIPL